MKKEEWYDSQQGLPGISQFSAKPQHIATGN